MVFLFKEKGCCKIWSIRKLSPAGTGKKGNHGRAETGAGCCLLLKDGGQHHSFLNLQCAGQEIGYT